MRVEGSDRVPGRFPVKLESERDAGGQTTILAILCDPHCVARSRDWVAGLNPLDQSLDFGLIGVNAALGAMETKQGQPTKVGVLGIVTDAAQAQTAETGKQFPSSCPIR